MGLIGSQRSSIARDSLRKVAASVQCCRLGISRARVTIIECQRSVEVGYRGVQLAKALPSCAARVVSLCRGDGVDKGTWGARQIRRYA